MSSAAINPAQPTPLLLMENINKVYRAGVIETHALRQFNLRVNTGEFIAITGPSGSGKTTFLNIAGLIENYDSGRYLLDGVDTQNLHDRDASQLRSQKIGFIFQGFNLLPDLSVFDNIDMPLRYRGMPAKARQTAIEEALHQVGLISRAKHLPAELSGGQQQRVAIARALAGKPAVLLADEPTGNLDTQMARQIIELLESLNDQGTSIIMVTHDVDIARRAHRHIQIVDGQVAEWQRSAP